MSNTIRIAIKNKGTKNGAFKLKVLQEATFPKKDRTVQSETVRTKVEQGEICDGMVGGLNKGSCQCI